MSTVCTAPAAILPAVTISARHPPATTPTRGFKSAACVAGLPASPNVAGLPASASLHKLDPRQQHCPSSSGHGILPAPEQSQPAVCRVVSTNKEPALATHAVSRQLQHRLQPLRHSNLEQVIGWSVVLSHTQGVSVGTVDQVRHTDVDSTSDVALLRVVKPASVFDFDGRRLEEVHLLPCVPEIVSGVDPSKKVVVVTPPEGLLNLGRQAVLLDRLKGRLAEITEPALGSINQQLGARQMLTRKRLEQEGKHDLVLAINAAGGFLTVAQVLGLRSTKRPVGYWDNLDNLDWELSLYIACAWSQFDEEDGQAYYYNQVTGQTEWEMPQVPHRIPLDDAGDFLLVEDDRHRLMPSRAAITAGGRYDLHHAILYHGGYREASQLLERPPAWPRRRPALESLKGLAAELRAFAVEAGLPRGRLPTRSQLQAAGRSDLMSAILLHGGWHSVAASLKKQTQRRPVGHWNDLDNVVREMEEFIAQHAELQVRKTLPTLKQLAEAGRSDLRYALDLHGSNLVAARLGLATSAQGRLSLRKELAASDDACQHDAILRETAQL